MKRILIITLLIATLVVAGCGSSEPATNTRSAFLGGTEGVVANFELFGVVEDSIQSIFDTETFPIEVTIQNKGENDLAPGDVKLELLGPAEEEFNGVASRELQNQDDIEKISELSPEGGEETIVFADEAQFNEGITNFLDRTWFANIEYDYKTFIVIPEVCLKEDLTDDRVCDVKGTKEHFVSGAPITVDQNMVTEDTAGRGIMALKIKIRNAKNGDVAKQGEEFDDRRDKLSYTIDDDDWECKSAGKVNEARLFNGEADIVCKLKEALAEDTIATKQVKLTLEYTYRELIEETVRIKESS